MRKFLSVILSLKRSYPNTNLNSCNEDEYLSRGNRFQIQIWNVNSNMENRPFPNSKNPHS